MSTVDLFEDLQPAGVRAGQSKYLSMYVIYSMYVISED